MTPRSTCTTALLAITLFAAYTASAQQPAASSQTPAAQTQPPPEVPAITPPSQIEKSLDDAAATRRAKQKARSTYQAPKPVPIAEPADAIENAFFDKHDKVRFTVPRGWELSRKDGEISTFHLDARSAPATAQLRGIAMLDFNPFPYSTLAGALFYFSVESHTTDAECAAQAHFPAGSNPDPSDTALASTPIKKSTDPALRKDVQDIAGITFAHGHDEHGGICIEARDEVYTAWHKHSCYRFDLAMNTFCSESSGAQPISAQQVRAIDQRMTNILSTVTFGWQKTTAHPISAPDVPEEPHRKKPLPLVPSPAAT